MNAVMTVCGPIAAEELGFCQSHEHLALSKGVSFQKNPALLIDDADRTTQEAIRLVKAGGNTVIDAQPGGCNRIERDLMSISQKSGLNIIASTGFHKLCFYPENHWIFSMPQQDLCHFFLSELTDGMYSGIDRSFCPENTGIRAGIVKMALDSVNLTQRYEALFCAGAKAALEADVPVMIHIEAGSNPLLLLHFLLKTGLAAHRIIFCHMDRAVPDLSIHKALLEQGVFLEYDTIGRFKYHSDLQEIEIFSEMLNCGYEDQLLFSLDTTRARLKAYEKSAVGLDYLLTAFVPLMIQNGITEQQIHKISHDNFIRVFS